MKLKTLDLFSGIGGFSLGLERTGQFKTVAFCEIDKYCKLLLQKHWKGVKIYDDVKKITKEGFEADGIESPDIITGGFPCQPFSVAGRKKGTRDNRYLWPQMFRVIKEFKPRWIIAENVRGIINIQHGMVFERVHTDLESQGYETQTFIIPAAGIGAPHRRDRVWIVANSNSNREKWNQSEDRKGSRTKQSSKDVANSSSIQSDGRGRSNDSIKEQGQKQAGGTSGSVANTNSERSQRYGKEYKLRENSQKIKASRSSTSKRDETGWDIEPDVGRVADGVQGRIHRLKGLGNSIIPQIAEEIGKAIVKAMK